MSKSVAEPYYDKHHTVRTACMHADLFAAESLTSSLSLGFSDEGVLLHFSVFLNEGDCM